MHSRSGKIGKILEYIFFLIVIVALSVYAYKNFDYIKSYVSPTVYVKPPVSDSFVFTAAGDYLFKGNTSKVLDGIRKANASFSLALGDFQNVYEVNEEAWCKYIDIKLGKEYPLMLISGNHESDGRDGIIDKYLQCRPNKIGKISGTYGKEYSFDYPEENPLARVILISPDLSFKVGNFSYGAGSKGRLWLVEQIAEARRNDIPWVIVGMHKSCISIGDKGCEIGFQLMNLIIENGADLILHAHSHNYSRSKQVTCVEPKHFNSSCVYSEDKNNYIKGNGSIFAVVGTGGADMISAYTRDPELPYFAAVAGKEEKAHGFLKIKISKEKLVGEFVGVDKNPIIDNFIITK